MEIALLVVIFGVPSGLAALAVTCFVIHKRKVPGESTNTTKRESTPSHKAIVNDADRLLCECWDAAPYRISPVYARLSLLADDLKRYRRAINECPAVAIDTIGPILDLIRILKALNNAYADRDRLFGGWIAGIGAVHTLERELFRSGRKVRKAVDRAVQLQHAETIGVVAMIAQQERQEGTFRALGRRK